MLAAEELHTLWKFVDEERRLDFLASLSEHSAQELLAFQQRGHEQRFAQRPRREDGLAPEERFARCEANRQAQARCRERQRAAASTN